jgi:hypothetical protein
MVPTPIPWRVTLMIQLAPDATPIKRTRRSVTRSTTPRADKPIKTAVCLSPESMRRLAVYCAVEGRTQSSVIEELIGSSPLLRRYVVQDRGRDRAASVEADDRATVVGSAD